MNSDQETAARVVAGEQVLARQLSARQLTMMAIGGAIGTGLFLGSGLSIRVAGPGIIITYLIGAVVALLLMGALSEMAVAYPTAGSFGVYAEIYLSPWAGFVSRWTYWAAQVIAIGGEMIAVAIYCRWWFPQVPAWLWITGFSAALVYINARNVGSFGAFEYWFAMIKVVTIVLFIIFGLAVIIGPGSPGLGLQNYTAHGGFLPHGWTGVWQAIVFVIFSYIGVEVIAVTAGEAADPQKAVPRAMRSLAGRLTIFYVGAIMILAGVVPWTELLPGGRIEASPFVRVFQLSHIPAATHLMNFVVLTAALSSVNCNLYIVTRMLFSLSRGGYAPKVFGQVSERGVPLRALLASTGGLALAVWMAGMFPDSAYVHLFGIALFGGLFVWLLIFITHLRFRRVWQAQGGRPLPVRMPFYPYTSLAGALLLVAIICTTWLVEGMQGALKSGLPWLALLSIVWLIRRGRAQASQRAFTVAQKG
ncbi:MAG TPA: amino acid permease [Blastocatellia bacterium]|nr:amino acid permease [Blastocatellia bacterium]